MGDFGQLPPVLDLPMYSKAPLCALAHLRNGKVMRADWHGDACGLFIQLSHHMLNTQEKASFKDAQVLVSTHQAMESINQV